MVSNIKNSSNDKQEIFDGPRLIQVKGRRNIFSRQVELSSESLNNGDCFLLDTGKSGGIIYQWNGNNSNRIVKGKAMDVAKNIKDKDRQGMSKVVVLDEGKIVDEVNTHYERFWKYFPTRQDLPSGEPESTITQTEKTYWSHVKLFKVIYEANQQLELEEVASGRIRKETLDDKFCFILDSITELFVWTGKKSPLKVKNASVKLVSILSALYLQPLFF